MRKLVSVLLFAIATGQPAARALLPGDADRGAAVFRTRGCALCHSVHGQGGTGAPDLGVGTDRSLSPYAMAGVLWNHAPTMWAAMAKQGMPRPGLSEQDAADLFVYFFASRYFEQPGDPRRGRQVFALRQCSGCHGVASAIREGVQPTSSWESLANPIALAQQMWNHSREMRPALEQNKIPYPQLSAQDMTDLLAYVRTTQGRGHAGEFSPGPADSGEKLFAAKGCAACHVGSLHLEARHTRYSLTDFAAAMWNHPHRSSRDLPPLSYEEMRRLLGYLISAQFFEERGDLEKGKAVYEKKRCGACHDSPSGGAPSRDVMTGRMTSFGMVAALWEHGPKMSDLMRAKSVPWPRFSGSEMADLTTYLRGVQLRRRPPTNNPPTKAAPEGVVR